MIRDKMLISIKEKIERKEDITRLESAFLYKLACEAVQQIPALEIESAERLELLIEVSNEVKKENYEVAWKKAIAYVEGVDFDLLMAGHFDRFD
ncbi:hypothetical protein ABIA69_003389 [Lysinibacillus parviboronicapiens]|uniref:Uncharacterized protein n=1 Tax=Lysinibacillus parviboronicapiens TaxID=436516 RepID=A0ABV2PNK7_9BACI